MKKGRRSPKTAPTWPPPPSAPPPPPVSSADVFAFQIKQAEGQLLRTVEELAADIANYLLVLRRGDLPAVCGVNPNSVTHAISQHATLLALKDALNVVKGAK